MDEREVVMSTQEYDMAHFSAEEVIAAARELVMGTTPFISALEVGHDADGERLHQRLREALGISEQDWADSPDR